MSNLSGSSLRRLKKETLSRDQLNTRWMAYRLSVLPDQLDLARRKVRALENEARRLGMTELLEVGQ